MSQFWHAHWAEEGYKPNHLRNWEIPKWHAKWPVRHCTTTKFEAHTNGRLYASVKRSNPWGNFKGTWELPLKIDRRTAQELSRSTEYKKAFWKAHEAKHDKICNKNCKVEMKKEKSGNKEETIKLPNNNEKPAEKTKIVKKSAKKPSKAKETEGCCA